MNRLIMTNGRSKTCRVATFIVFVYWISDLVLQAKAAPAMMETRAKNYLTQYGYMSSAVDDLESQPSNFEAYSMSSAISMFQDFTGIDVTGTLNDETVRMMSMPRCGVPDMVQHETDGRVKRQAYRGTKWDVKDLTYRIRNYHEELTTESVDKEIARAFSLWAEYTDLTFTRREYGKVNIEIGFYSLNHGDGYKNSFDGPGHTLAHAFSPKNGTVHFDYDEFWTIEGLYGINLFQVAVHEFGHALGLDHSKLGSSSVMHPYYEGYISDLKLDEEDILGIQALYGSKTGRIPEKIPEKILEICEDPTVDAMLTSADGDIFAFRGNYYWKLTLDGAMGAAEHPKLISEKWKGLPGNINAAFTYGKWTYFFKGSKYWRYGDQQVGEEPYSGYISHGFPGIPDDIDAATVWTGDRKLYFFKGDQVWEFDSNELRTTSQSISEWRGLPDNLDAAVEHKGYTFFFKDDGHYRFNHNTFSVDQRYPPFPRPNGGWFGCPFPYK